MKKTGHSVKRSLTITIRKCNDSHSHMFNNTKYNQLLYGHPYIASQESKWEINNIYGLCFLIIASLIAGTISEGMEPALVALNNLEQWMFLEPLVS
jgi:hypothetical protein